ncbi:MAG: pyridoxamine 5'-phosphate oxidase family protein [Candidatus Heimdallarchaeota archaeon]|nr:pyridoxamine 5'-phosphate oxidase family protein [Candidatus Heimdallarchaeota archaeon]
MTKEDIDSIEAITKMREELDFNEFKTQIIKTLNESRHIVLATSANNRVSTRTVSFANDDLVIYIISWDHNLKINQIKENPLVALCLNNIQIEGIAELINRPTDDKNNEIQNIYRKKFSEIFVNTFFKIPELITIKIVPNRIVKFENFHNRFFLQHMNLKNKSVHQMRNEDRNNSEFPY